LTPATVWHGLDGVVSRFGEVDGRLALAALAFHLTNHVLRSVAWRNVLAAAYPSERVPLVGVTAAYAVGVALNAVIPGRGGDAAKIALVRSRVRGSSVATIASTMSVVVLFDLVAATVLVLTVCLTGAVPFAPRLPLTDAAAWAGAHAPLVVAVAACSGVAVAVSARRLRDPLRRLWIAARRGGAILHTPGRYLSRVVVVQAAAWGCRIAVVYCLLAAFGVEATIPRAALVMVLCGASTLVPLTPGGAGTQQVMLAYALSQAATAAVVLSFSIGMQAGITVVNAILGVAAAMVAFRTLHPVAAARRGFRLVRAGA
jgi:uncharacterized membrane protein YbhN (UPF0104 family)